MAGTYSLQNMGESVESAYGSNEENFIPVDEDDLSDEDAHEQNRLIRRRGTVGDMEEGSSNSGGRGKRSELKVGSKCHVLYLSIVTCGFLASAFSFNVGVIFAFKCSLSLQPGLLTFMGFLGAVTQFLLILKLFRKRFVGFKSYEEASLDSALIFFAVLWFCEIFILRHSDKTQDLSMKYCKPILYRYAALANLIPILGLLFHNFLKCTHQKKWNEAKLPTRRL